MSQSNHEELIQELRRGFGSLATRLDQTNERLDQTNKKIDAGFKEISRKFDGIGKYLQVIDNQLDEHIQKFADIDSRLDNLEA
ncbi:MAG TPA: hypothetical protein PKC98_21280 [Candidatus Melainabacteria bacterium]|nr:hypothetical protein [Candidatus Melainabacteria bacterium]